jgi:hypothetical protein
MALPNETVVRKIRMFAAMGMYRTGELSIGAASELAGVDRYIFLDFCKREGITVQTQTPDELESEFRKS